MIYLIGIIVLGFLIFIHELGHYTMARLSKIPVLSFAIGFGPSIFKFKQGITEYKLNIIPLGGYVQLEGETDSDKDDPKSFVNQRWYKRLAVLLGGVLFNFVSAILMMIILTSVYGAPQSKYIISNVLEESNAKQYIKQGDFLISINDTILNNDNYNNVLTKQSDTEAKIVVEQNGIEKSYIIPLCVYEGKNVVGIINSPKTVFVKGDSLISNLSDAFKCTGDVFKLIGDSLKMLCSGQVSTNEMSGPVGIVKITGDIAKQNIPLLIYWVILLDINLGVMNALPIPALDGGQTLFLFIEMILGKKRWNNKIASTLNLIFFTILILFLILVTYQDVIKLIP